MRRLVVPMLDGKLIADVSTDPDYPGIDVEFVSDKDNGTDLSRPRVLVEQTPDGELRTLILNDPKSEDYTLEYLMPFAKDPCAVEKEHDLEVELDAGTLIAKRGENDIRIELVTGAKWNPQVLINSSENKIQLYIWRTPRLEYKAEKVILYSQRKPQEGLTIRNLIQELQRIEDKYPDTVVKMHHPKGDGIMFAVAGKDGNVWLEGREDMDVIEELRSQYEIAAETQRDELDFFTEMVDRGFTLTDFCFALSNDQYLYAKNFMEEHGLI